MKRLLAIFCLVSLVLLITNQAIATDILMTFEEFQGHDGQAIGTYYSGVTFQAASSGQDWIAADVTTGNYNTSSWPSGQQWGSGDYWMYGNVFAWTGVSGNDGKISFNNQDATFVELGYCSLTGFWLDAYDSGGTLIASDSGPANRRYSESNPNGPGTLTVVAPPEEYISYVIVHDTGNFWCVDNIMTNATPEPATICLLGLGGLALLRKRRAL